MPGKPDLELAVGLTMDKEFGPFPDYESAVKWLEQRRNFAKDSWVAKSLTPKEVAWRVKTERRKGSIMVSVEGYDNKKLPDTDIKIAMANHFSSCGEIVGFSFYPFGSPKSYPGRSVTIHILGEDAKEKVQQLNGSELGGRKLVVTVPFNPTVPQRPIRPGYGLPESARRQLALLQEQKKARREEHENRCAQKIMRKQLMKEKEALRNQTKTKLSSVFNLSRKTNDEAKMKKEEEEDEAKEEKLGVKKTMQRVKRTRRKWE